MKKMSITRADTTKRIFIAKALFLLFLLPVSLSARLARTPNHLQADTIPGMPEIDNSIFRFLSENNVPGMSLAVTKDEKIVYVKSYGFADTEKSERATNASLYRIASISKPLTSIAILKLAEEKKLSLDDKIFGPSGILKNKYGTKPYGKDLTEITVRHLLQHLAGGWANDKDDPMFFDTAWNTDKLITFTLDSFALKNKPGTRYAYSNFGYCLLGRVIETVTGQDYESYVKKTLLAPLGITDMQVGGNSLSERKPNEVKYYDQNNDDPYSNNVSRMDAHGGWIASATSLIKILSHVDGGGNVSDIISPESFKTMITAPEVSPKYACGWFVDSLGNFWHTGSLPGTRTLLKHTNNGYGYALLLNTRNYDSLFGRNLRELVETIQAVSFPSAGETRTYEKYGLKTVFTLEEYNATVQEDPNQKLVALDKFIPGIKLDIRYATSNNIMNRPLYSKAMAFMRLAAAEALKTVQQELQPLGYGIKIYDAYRPYDVTVTFYERFLDTTFVASPYTGSRHNRGCAVDMTLIDLKTGREIEMPTPYDSFTRQAHSAYPDLSEKVLRHRDILQKVMLKNGFQIYPDEWWHFDFVGWEKYSVMNIPFEILQKIL